MQKRIYSIYTFILLFITPLLFLYSYSEEIKMEERTPLKIVGLEEDKGIFFNRVRDLKYNSQDGKIYIADGGNNRIVIMDENLNMLKTFGKGGQGPGDLSHPYCLSFNKNNNLIVLELRTRRFQIMDKNGSYISSFMNPTGWINFACTANDNIYIGKGALEALLFVLDLDGNKIAKFGECYEKIEDPFMNEISNNVLCESDNENNIYCVFMNHPIIRKYDKNHNLVFEKKTENFVEIKNALKKWKEELESLKKKYEENSPVVKSASKRKRLVYDVSIDDKCLYLLLQDNGMYLMDNESGDFERKYVFKSDDSLKVTIGRLCARSDKFIYGFDYNNNVIVKFEK